MERKDVWSAGDLYEPYVGRWSRLVAREFLSWLSVPVGMDWLDVGCGTGALTQVILETATPHAVSGIDPSAGFIEYAKSRIASPLASFAAPKPLAELFAHAGLRVVEVRPIDVLTRFRDFDDYWSPFLGGQGPAPGYAMSLSKDRRNTLRDRIRSQLPVVPDGTIELIARAWTVSGRAPS
jgi:hypothetical protein